MEILYFFESIRNEFLDFIMLNTTKFGEELIFMLIAVFVLWCVDKKSGYYLLFVGFLGIQLNQVLKVTFRVPRPWVKDPNFTIVEAARAEATGFSFPSGHTQTAVGTYGTLFAIFKNRWVKLICALICIIVPVSRMYLGVHTLADVGVSFLLAVFLVVFFGFIMKAAEKDKKVMRLLLSGLTLFSFVLTVYMTVKLKNETNEQLKNALENFYKMLGSVLGMFLVYELDTRCINYETKAVWWAQIIKVVLGLGIIVGIKLIGYKVFGAFLWLPAAKGITYFLLVAVAGVLWPMTFKYFSKMGKKPR